MSYRTGNLGDRHCERSEAIQSFLAILDCFVAPLLAMTNESFRGQFSDVLDNPRKIDRAVSGSVERLVDLLRVLTQRGHRT
jgi:hypothetical protein